MTILTEGIVIHEKLIGDKDKVITLLTEKQGVLRAFANGAKTLKSKLISSTELFSFCIFSIEKTKNDSYIIKEATPKKVFFSLREDLNKLALGQYLCEFTKVLAPQEEEAEEFLSLLLNSLYLLSSGKKSQELIKCTTELRMLALAGFTPGIIGCCECGRSESEAMFFNAFTGELYCQNCKTDRSFFRLTLGEVAAMRHICFSPGNKIFAFSLPEDQLQNLNEATELYLRAVTDKKYKTLDFYKKMTRI